MEKRRRPRRGRNEAADIAGFADEIRQLALELVDDGLDRGEAKLMARALREMRDSFKALSPYRQRRKVTVFGSARTGPETAVYQQAVEFGRAMAAHGYMLITGAGPGVMEAVHVGAGREMSVGLNIVLPFEQSANPIIEGDPKLLSFHYFFTRKLLFLKEADALVLFPGGFGTLDEGFEVLTMLQTGKAKTIPIVLIEPPGREYWEHWRTYVRDCLLGEGMISEEDLALFRITHSVEEAAAEITRFYRVYHSQRYVRGELVLRLLQPIPDDLFAELGRDFASILSHGEFRRGQAHPHEANEPHAASLPRLYIPFNRRSHGRLRQLIDVINEKA